MRKRFVVLVCALVFLCLPAKALADSYDVTASVLAPLPPETPVVTGPENNTVLQNDTVYVSGTCVVVVPNLIVVLVRDNEVIGSGNCLPDGTFRILVGLVLGTNVIYPKFVTITGQSSAFAPPITLTYRLVKDAETANPEQTGDGVELFFRTDFVQYNDSTPTPINFTIKGGKPPYRTIITWGDGTQEEVMYTSSGDKQQVHQYKNFLPSSVVTVKVIDANGTQDVQSRALVSFEKGVYIPPAVPQPTRTSISAQAVYLIGAGSLTGALLLSRYVTLGHPFATSIFSGARRFGRRK